MNEMTPQIRRQGPADLSRSYRTSQRAFPQTIHLGAAILEHLGCGLLIRMHAEGCQESRQSLHFRSGIPEPQEQIPIDGELEFFVNRASDVLPDSATPEERLLGNV